MVTFPKPRRLLAAGVLAAVLCLLVIAPAYADSIEFPNPVSPNGENLRNLYRIISVPAIVVFLFVEGWLLLCAIRYRRGRLGPNYVPPQWHGNRLLEVAWTAIPLLIVLTIAALSFVELQRDFVRASDQQTQMDVTVTGYQFGWNYDYGQGVTSTNTLYVPVGKLVRLRVRTRDVIHSWWVPNITGKTDAVPGYDNFTWMNLTQVGKWHGECAELCGAGHYQMLIDVQSMSQSDFDSWFQKQQQKAKPSPSPSASAGSSPAASSSPSP